MRTRLVFTLVLLFPLSSFAADTAPAPPAPSGEKNKWIDISATTFASLESQNKKIGYPGKAAGITCDPVTGDVYMIIPDNGIWLSADHGNTFTRADNKTIGGRCETGATLQRDPAGKRLACFMLDGQAGYTLDAGKTWTPFTGNGRGWDFASVDWSAEKLSTILAMHHESGGQLFLSTDAGKTWIKNAKDPKFNCVGVFDAKTFIAAKSSGGISRTTDAGVTWKDVSTLTVTSHVPVVYNKIAYLIAREGLITSKDAGLTWEKRGAAVDATMGPIFADEKHLVIWGKKGIFESTDAGEKWNLILTFPPDYNKYNGEWFNNVGWDPKADIFYISHMGLPAYRWAR